MACHSAPPLFHAMALSQHTSCATKDSLDRCFAAHNVLIFRDSHYATYDMANAQDFIGKWRIIGTEAWDRDALDLVAPASLSFEKDNMGQLKFIAVEAWIDYRVGEREGLPAVEFSFEGLDERDRVSGRAWAVLDGKQLRGRVYFHRGDDSSFVAERFPGRKLGK